MRPSLPLTRQTLAPLVVLCFIFFSCSKPTGVYSITDFGAESGGMKCTRAIQKAIDECYAQGGGTVLVPPGTFVTGTLVLRSHIQLELQKGAVLLASTDTADYTTGSRRNGLLIAENEEDISITGEGLIDGNGPGFHNFGKAHTGVEGVDLKKACTRQGSSYMDPAGGWEDGPIAYTWRPGMMIVFSYCQNIKIVGVTLKESPEWTVRFANCDNVLVHGVSIYNSPLIPNNDGIHCTSSTNIRISDCDIRAGDDGIIMTGFEAGIDVSGHLQKTDKEIKFGNKENVACNMVVSNCLISSSSSGIRIGYGNNDIRNCSFQNLVIYNSNRGIGLFVRDKGSIEDISFNNITIHNRFYKGHWWGKGEPVHLSVIRQSADSLIGSIRNIRFSGINMNGENGIVIYAEKPGQIADIQFEQMNLHIRKSPLEGSYGGNFDLRPAYPLDFAIFKMDMAGLYAQNVSRLKINGFALSWEDQAASYATRAIQVKGFDGLLIQNFEGTTAPGYKGAAILLESGKNATVSGRNTLPGAPLLQLENVR